MLTDEKIQQGLNTLRDCCQVAGIKMDLDNEVFRAAEKLFWIGLIHGVGSENIPPDIQLLLIANRSPLLERKVKRTRKPRIPKKENLPIRP
jgi:hypothetical protein